MNDNTKINIGAIVVLLLILIVFIVTWEEEKETIVEIEVEKEVIKTVPIVKEIIIENTHYIDRTRIINFDRITYTTDELKELENLVMCESGSNSFMLQLAVASVIVNRVNDERYPDNLHDVIFQKEPCWQFTPSAKGLEVTPNESVKRAVTLALQIDYTNNCWMFNNKSLTSDNKQSWFDKFKVEFEIDNVQFRKDRYER